ncbi:hypothetical protein HY638_05230 [Candidatus Woesearchaeota archaeon]|nr:hypothetical protein [Candidatus Woesearchaeota archaeon]
MDNHVKKDILAIMQQAIDILGKENPDAAVLRELSNHTIHNASIYQDEDSVSIAILVYAISKIIERGADKKCCSQIYSLLKESYGELDQGRIGEYKALVRKIFGEVTKIESKFKMYIEEVIRQAQIKKGSKIFEHGISLARASEMLGISQWELMSYVGKTSIADTVAGEEMTKKRLAIARSLFG